MQHLINAKRLEGIICLGFTRCFRWYKIPIIIKQLHLQYNFEMTKLQFDYSQQKLTLKKTQILLA